MQLQLHLATPAEVANLPLGTPLQRTSRRVVHVGPGRSHRPFFLPLFTNVVEGVFSEVRIAPVQHVYASPADVLVCPAKRNSLEVAQGLAILYPTI
jgi:hypothetical protein